MCMTFRSLLMSKAQQASLWPEPARNKAWSLRYDTLELFCKKIAFLHLKTN